MSAKLVTGYSQTPQDLVVTVKDFLTAEVGWGLAQTVEETDSVKDYVFSSEYSSTTSSGTTVTGTFCIRVAGYSGFVGVYGYDACTTTATGTTYSGEIHDSTYSRMKCPSEEFQYWAIADSGCMKMVVRSEDYSEYYHGYIGLVDSFYYGEHDPVPVLVYATSSETSNWTDGLSTTMSTASGGVFPYSVWSTYSEEFGDSARTSKCGGIKPILYLQSPAGQQEVRGFPKGVYKIPASCGGNGIRYTVGSGTYCAFVKSGTQIAPYMYGPVYE